MCYSTIKDQTRNLAQRSHYDLDILPEILILQSSGDNTPGKKGTAPVVLYGRVRAHASKVDKIRAFLRAHYPAEFMASVISNGGGYYSTLGYLSEAKRMGLKILPPDINRSEIKYTGKGREIWVGLMQLKDPSQDSKDTIIHERSKNGPFISLEDFLDRTGSHIHLQDIRILIKAGCFDSIVRGTTRPGLMWHALRFFDQKEEEKTLTLFSAPHKMPPALKKGEKREKRDVVDYRDKLFL